MQKSCVTLACAAGLMLATLPAFAQQYGRTSDPNFGHFYMARQQIDIEDDAPIVNDRRSQPGAPGAGGNGGLPAGPMALPKAGWQPYSASMPGMQTALPKVNNGVPPKLPPSTPGGLRGNAGALKAKPAAAAVRNPNQVESYSSYRGYGGHAGNLTPAAVGGGGSAAGGMNSSTNVQGSVLHWRQKRPSY